MSTSTSARDYLQNPETAFKHAFEAQHIGEIRNVKGQALTPGALLDRLRMRASEAEETYGENDPLNGKQFKNRAAVELKAIRAGNREGMSKESFENVDSQKDLGGNVIDAGITESATPLVFDPDVLQLLKDNAPHAFGRLTRRGQQGFQVAFNNISSREAPAGYGTEADSAQLQDYNREFDFDTVKVDISKYMDAAAVTDFSAEASSHYLTQGLSELSVGARMAEYAQLHEQTVLYGDPGTATQKADLDAGETGGPGDPNAFNGLYNIECVRLGEFGCWRVHQGRNPRPPPGRLCGEPERP